MITLYGIKNCDTVKRALTALDRTGIAYSFHDFKTAGLSVEEAEAFLTALGPEAVINRRGTTWRKLSADDQARAEGEGAAQLLSESSSLVKRPVWRRSDGAWAVGFAKKEEEAMLAWASEA